MNKTASGSKSDASSSAALARSAAATMALIVASSVMLSWVAFYNRAPLVFPDTVAYATAALEREVPGLFSVYYSIFILPLHQGVTLWPVVLVQAAILGHLLYLIVRCLSGGKIGKLQILLIVAVLCLLSSLPWITGQIMPDVFSPIVLLGVYLLAFCADQLTRRELLYISALTTIGIATHFSHVPIALGLILLGAVIRPIFAPVQVGLRQWAALLLLPLVIAICAMLAVNWINSGEISFARNSNVFLLAKLIDEGPAFSYLAQACPQVNYALCAHLENLRGLTHDDLKWGADSPFQKVGGFDQLEPEARHIVWATLWAYPLEVLQRAIVDSGRQLLRFQVGDGLTPDFARFVGGYLGDVFGPEVEKSLVESKQGQGRLPIAEFRLLNQLGLIFGVAYCVWSVIVARELLSARLLAFYIFVPAGIVWNAVVTGTLSGPYDRYLARVIWILCFAGLVGFCYLSRVRRLEPADRKVPLE